MENSISNKTQNRLARIAGLLYSLMIPLGAFGILYIPSMMVDGNAEATIGKVISNISLFRLTVISAIVVQITHIFIVVLLYQLLKSIHNNMAMLMVIFMLVSIPITLFNELNNYAVISLTDGNGINNQEMIMLFFKLHEYGILIASIFWGLWLFPMGYLVYHSRFLPKSIGIILMVACCGYVLDSLLKLALPEYGGSILASIIGITMYGEIIFPLWLLIRGIKTPLYSA